MPPGRIAVHIVRTAVPGRDGFHHRGLLGPGCADRLATPRAPRGTPPQMGRPSFGGLVYPVTAQVPALKKSPAAVERTESTTPNVAGTLLATPPVFSLALS